MVKASFVRYHNSSEFIEVEGIDYADKREKYTLSLYDGIVEHCAKSLTDKEMVEIYKCLCIQLQQLGKENIPYIFNEMFEEFKIAMKNRNISI